MSSAPNLVKEGESGRAPLSVATTPTNASKPADGSVLLWLIKDGPMWARVPAILVALFVAVAPSALLVRNAQSGRSLKEADQPSANQLQMAASTDAMAREGRLNTLLSKVDLTEADRNTLRDQFSEMQHQIQHLNNPADAVKWTIFAQKSSTDYFGYKLFPSDRCLLIARIENGVADAQWLRDPIHFVSATSKTTEHARSSPSQATAALMPAAFVLMPRTVAELEDRLVRPATLAADPVQAGCLAQHPGTARESWQPYLNRCQQPVVRTWGDGCTQVQVFDHCSGAWGPVVWQFCAANHHP